MATVLLEVDNYLFIDSTLGKMLQRSVREEQHYMATQAELDAFVYKSQSQIRGWTIISNDLIHVRSMKLLDYAPPNLNNNLVIGSYVTAYVLQLILFSKHVKINYLGTVVLKCINICSSCWT